MKSTILGKAAALAVAAATLIPAPAHATTSPVTYCETYFTDGRFLTRIETTDWSMTVVDMTIRRSPFAGGAAYLVESPVEKHRPRINHCNGTKIVTADSEVYGIMLYTSGGAEWFVANPVVTR